MVDRICSSEYLRTNLSSEHFPRQKHVFRRDNLGQVSNYYVWRLNELSRCNRAEVELYTIEFDMMIARRLNRA